MPSSKLLPHPPAAFVWIDHNLSQRNSFGLFRYNCMLHDAPTAATLSVFADTRYRLWVNGTLVGMGPARFSLRSPEFDTWDITSSMQQGANTIGVEVNNRGARSYQAVPSHAGFIAWGTITDASGLVINCATPNGWRCHASEAWLGSAAEFSFARAAVEICDLGRLDANWSSPSFDDSAWHTPQLLDRSHWGELAGRSIPYPPLSHIHPTTTIVQSACSDDEIKSGFGFLFSRQREAATNCIRLRWYSAIYSPKPQTVTAGLFWGPFYLNGIEVQPHTTRSDQGNRIDYTLNLTEGWNLLYGEPEVLSTSWGLMMALPVHAQLRLSANPLTDCTASMGFSDAEHIDITDPQRPIPATFEQLPQKQWHYPQTADDTIPARAMAWDRPAAAPCPQAAQFPLAIALSTQGEGMVVVDFEREYFGHVCLQLSAPAGTIIDIGNDERLNPNGTIALYKASFQVNAADRFICREGRQSIEGFHPAGGRYLQLSIRATPGAAVTIHHLSIRSKQCTLAQGTPLVASNPLFAPLWKLCEQSVRDTLDEGWIDPWREQGLYLGDTRVQYLASTLLDAPASNRFLLRALKLWRDTQHANGQLPAVTPADFPGFHGDFSLLYIILCADYEALSNSTDVWSVVGPTIEAILASPIWLFDSDGLIDPQQSRAFIDWGVDKRTRTAPANALLSALFIAALKCSAALCEQVHPQRSAQLRARAAQMTTAFRTRLWDRQRNQFAAGRDSSGLIPVQGVHHLVMALFAGVADEEQIQSCLHCIEQAAQHNAATALQGEEFAGQMELYFLNFALSVLGQHGRAQAAELLIEQNWSPHLQKGALRLWEALCRGSFGFGSECHSWSAAPMLYMAHHLLGYDARCAQSGNTITLRPLAHDIRNARGELSMPTGERLHIDWQATEDSLHITLRGPERYTYRVEPRGRLSHLRVNMKIQP